MGGIACALLFMVITVPPPAQPVRVETPSHTLPYEQAISAPRESPAGEESETAKDEATQPETTAAAPETPSAPVENKQPAALPPAGEQDRAALDELLSQDTEASESTAEWPTNGPDSQQDMAVVPREGEGDLPPGPDGYQDAPPPPGEAGQPPSSWGDENAEPWGDRGSQQWGAQQWSHNGPQQWGDDGSQQWGDDGSQQFGEDGPEQFAEQGQEEWVQVVLSGAPMHATASDDAPMLFAFPYGRNLRVVSRYEGWVEVTDPQSAATGWMKLQYLAPAAAARGGYEQYEASYPRERRRGLFERGGFADMINRAFGGGF